MNIKKIGLTALAGSLVATSSFAGEMSVSGVQVYIWSTLMVAQPIQVSHLQWVTS